MANEGGSNSAYTLEVKDDEAFLTVFPPEPDKAKCSAQEVKNKLEGEGINWIDQKLLDETIREASGSPVCVGRKVAEDAKVEVRIEKGAMAAYATAVPPSGDGNPLTLNKAKNDLELEGVTFGIKEDVLQELVESRKYNQDVLIAEGKPAVKGTDGYVEYHFEREGEHVHKKDEYGRVDHYDLGLFQSVVEEQLLATLHPPVKGHAGLTVVGDVIPEVPVQEAKISAGRNARLSPEGDKIYSEINGLVKLVGGQVSVDPVLEIKGWINGDTGNIEFVGDIIIRGGVEDGFTVTATENINIENAVGKAHVEAGGDIYIKGGLMGKTEGTSLLPEKTSTPVLFRRPSLRRATRSTWMTPSCIHRWMQDRPSMWVLAEAPRD